MRSWPVIASLLAASGCLRAASTNADYVTPAAELDHPLPRVEQLDVERWEGEWYVIATTFEFWKKKDRTDAKFVYADLPHASATKLWDATLYRQRGKGRRLLGVDTRDPSAPGHFLWHGVGSLAVARNHWYVMRVSEDYGWAIIGFPPSTLGTPAGLDIIAREPSLDPAILDAAFDWIRSKPELAPMLDDGVLMMEHAEEPASPG